MYNKNASGEAQGTDPAMIKGLKAALLKKRYDRRKSLKATWEEHWDEIATYISPRRLGFTGIRTPGEKRMRQVLDSTGIHSNNLLASGLHGMATNPANKWFALRFLARTVEGPEGRPVDINELPHIRKWLSDAEDAIWSTLYQPGSNLTQALNEAYQDLGAFGTAIIFMGERPNGGLFFECRHLAECVISENQYGVVDTVEREFEMTVRQIMQAAGKSLHNPWTPSEKVRDLFAKGHHDQKIKIIHSVHPNTDQDPNLRDRSNLAWASVYFEHEDCHILDEGGFNKFPYAVPRWSKVAGETYGRGPGMTALPDVKMLQAMELTTIKVGQKIADPPLWLKDDGVLGTTRTVPGGVNYWRGNPRDGVFPMPMPQNLPWVSEQMTQLRDRIRNTFMVDVLQMVDQRTMTLGEARMRLQERMRLMGPTVGRLESEMLSPMVDCVMHSLAAQGKLPETPEDIAEEEYTVKFVSPIALAQQQEDVGSMQEVFGMIGMMGPEVAAGVIQSELSPERMLGWMWEKFNLDPDLMKTPEEKEADAQQAAETQQQQQIAQAAPAMQQGAQAIKALGDTQAAGGMDLAALMNTMTEQNVYGPEGEGALAFQ